MAVANPFERADATRYARARPRYQSEVLNRAAQLLGLTAAVDLALDVGCGTGHSSMALKVWADGVVGLEPSRAMRGAAEGRDGIAFVNATAEHMPIRDRSVDLVAGGAVFHWLDAARFLTETQRVLRSSGAVIVYTDFFTGQILEAPQVATWIRETHVPRHPGPPRRPAFTTSVAAPFGFVDAGSP